MASPAGSTGTVTTPEDPYAELVVASAGLKYTKRVMQPEVSLHEVRSACRGTTKCYSRDRCAEGDSGFPPRVGVRVIEAHNINSGTWLSTTARLSRLRYVHEKLKISSQGKVLQHL